MVFHIQSSLIPPFYPLLSSTNSVCRHFCSHRSFSFLFCFFYQYSAPLHFKSYQFARKDMYVAFQCSSLFLLPSSTPSASRRILQKVRLPPLVSSRPSSFRYSSRILPSLFSCRHMSKFLRRSCFRIEGFLREEDVN